MNAVALLGCLSLGISDNLELILSKRIIDLGALREFCIDGCPDSSGLRSMSWKVMLNYLPPDTAKWPEHLKRCRKEYSSYVKDFITESCWKEKETFDHPLNSSPNSDWAEFFKDNEILMQINKDCKRLCPDLHFFRRATDFPSCKIFGPGISICALRKRVERSYLEV
ncbi:unnamed protein product [Protopolystoma xenopodis]|uniref:Rab-GAP TBC domain-containing protein n=1 Tax=Protopolystoma xenopodis TaxID=117903 RepID=A0A448WYR0_9PLAT|nr:unnamed protein product [Protopolystoma xenopodis]